MPRAPGGRLLLLPLLGRLASGNVVALRAPPGATDLDVGRCRGTQEETGLCESCFRQVDCKFAEWEEWTYQGGCSGVCMRKRSVARENNEAGLACEGWLKESKRCTGGDMMTPKDCPSQAYHPWPALRDGDTVKQPEPVDCRWSPWSSWSTCNRPCGNGAKVRARLIDQVGAAGGAPCEPLNALEVTACNTMTCGGPCQDGLWGAWGPWQACSVTCGAGLQRRSRREEAAASHCGTPAVGSEHEFRSCEAEATNAPGGGFLAAPHGCTIEEGQQACTLDEWSEWSVCRDSCSQGRDRVRRRSLTATTKLGLMEKEISDLLTKRMALEQKVTTLQAINGTLQEENSELAAKLLASKKDVQRYQLQASQAYSLEDELAAERQTNDALQQQNGELIEKLMKSRQALDKDATFITRLDRARDEMEGRRSGLHGRLVELQMEADKLRERNLGLQTRNMALQSEAEHLHSTADRLRLALPVGIGTVSVVALVGLAVGYLVVKQLPLRQMACPEIACVGTPGCLSPRNGEIVTERMYHHEGESSPGSPSSPGARSPFRGARGTLLSGTSSPKAMGPESVGPL